MDYMKHRTSINIEKDTRLRLVQLKIVKRDTYDEIINRMIDNELEKLEEFEERD